MNTYVYVVTVTNDIRIYKISGASIAEALQTFTATYGVSAERVVEITRWELWRRR